MGNRARLWGFVGLRPVWPVRVDGHWEIGRLNPYACESGSRTLQARKVPQFYPVAAGTLQQHRSLLVRSRNCTKGVPVQALNS
jgi:hypothetical protein